MRTRFSAAVPSLVLVACGSAATEPTNVISGSVAGIGFTNLAAAYWIGAPEPSSLPAIFFLFESPIDCPTISVPNWDKNLAESQLLEIGLDEAAERTFTVTADASASDAYVAYLRGEFNPDADSASITITRIEPRKKMVGSFEAHYSADTLSGSFDATYCATGVEP